MNVWLQSLIKPKNPFWATFSGLIMGLGHLSPDWTFVFVPLGLSLFLLQQDRYEKRHNPRAEFLFVWLFSAGYFVSSLYWISVALSIEISRYYWLMPFTFLGIPAVYGLFFPILSLLVPWTRFGGISKVALASIAWLLSELARSYLLTGFPWPLLGYAMAFFDPLNQTAYYATIFGLSFVTFWVSALPFVWMRSPLSQALLTTLGLTAILMGLSWAGYAHMTQGRHYVLPPLKMVQPNIPQTLKWNPAHMQANFRKLMKMSQMTPSSKGTVIIWPEAALTYFMSPTLGETLSQIIPENGYLITGSVRMDEEGHHFNSLYVIDHKGKIAETYDKNHLVPFGEYIPFHGFFQKLMPGVLRTVAAGMGMQSGRGNRTLKVQGVPPFAPLICYEVIFPKQVLASGGTEPAWILNLTNDAWFHDTAGPYQHLQSARFRAIEENLPLVRVANNGISAIIDPYGRILKKMDYNQTGILDVL